MPDPAPDRPIDRLLSIMARLRDPDRGCPWDVEQDFTTIAPYTIEEAYEVADAIARGDMADLKDELGDLLLQVVFHSRMAEELGHFRFDDVAEAIHAKMIRRHPHVFGAADADTPEAATVSWEAIKAEERKARPVQFESRLDGVPLALPALTRGLKLSRRAAAAGFEWPDLAAVWDKVDEEIGELKAEIEAGSAHDRLEDEFGDILFTLVNVARWLKVDPEKALARANAKVSQRFQTIERAANAAGERLEDWSLEQMEAVWQEAKARK